MKILPDCVVVIGDGAARDGGGGGGGHVGPELRQVGRGDRLQAEGLDGAHLDEQLIEQYPGKRSAYNFCRIQMFESIGFSTREIQGDRTSHVVY